MLHILCSGRCLVELSLHMPQQHGKRSRLFALLTSDNQRPDYYPRLVPSEQRPHRAYHMVDLINNIRFRAVPLSSSQRLLASSRPGVMTAQGAFGIAGIRLAPGFGPVGEYLFVLDLSTIMLCSYAPGHASIVG
ncbi:hypothetical protein M405DRAFT_576948 [Rhizopogon salebrosus TDB-379]|nr:hypothetical protein M405DRAFT_576948 [Rhizopogon salebrosus TDB-379]